MIHQNDPLCPQSLFHRFFVFFPSKTEDSSIQLSCKSYRRWGALVSLFSSDFLVKFIQQWLNSITAVLLKVSFGIKLPMKVYIPLNKEIKPNLILTVVGSGWSRFFLLFPSSPDPFPVSPDSFPVPQTFFHTFWNQQKLASLSSSWSMTFSAFWHDKSICFIFLLSFIFTPWSAGMSNSPDDKFSFR